MNAIGWATRYAQLGASSRLRHYQWAQRLEKAGYRIQMQPFFSDDYLRRLYDRSSRSRGAWLTGFRARRQWLKQAPQELILEYELIPFLPWCIERQLLQRHRYILDFDDNVWEKYRGKFGLAGKFDRLVEHAEAVIVANDFLYEKVRQRNSNVVKIPTPIDPADYPAELPKFSRFTVAWIGTPVTYSYLEQAAPALREMARHTDFELLVIASAGLAARPIAGVPMRWIDWHAEDAGSHLVRSHVGIMPLPDDPFARGKSAYKLIQYQGAGLPAIASGVGENNRVIHDGVNGFLADTPDAWSEALRRLADSPECYRSMAQNARETARLYTYDTWQDTYFKLVRTAFAAR